MHDRVRLYIAVCFLLRWAIEADSMADTKFKRRLIILSYHQAAGGRVVQPFVLPEASLKTGQWPNYSPEPQKIGHQLETGQKPYLWTLPQVSSKQIYSTTIVDTFISRSTL